MPTWPVSSGSNNRTERVALSYMRIAGRSARCISFLLGAARALLGRECHRDRGDRIARSDRAHTVVRLGLDAHALRRDGQASRDRAPHRRKVLAHARRLSDDRRVDRYDAVARLADLRPDLAQQLRAVCTGKTRVVAREMRSKIAETGRSEYRVHDRMEEDVAVGVTYEPGRMLDRYAAYYQAAARRETMNIVPEPDPGGACQCGPRAGIPTRPLATSSRA